MEREKEIEVANCILKGASYPDTEESDDDYLFPEWRVGETIYRCCAWGLAICGKYNTAKEAYEAKYQARTENYDSLGIIGYIEQEFGVDREFFKKVERAHLRGYSAETIAHRILEGTLI